MMGSSSTLLPFSDLDASDAGTHKLGCDDTPNRSLHRESGDPIRICGECFKEIAWNVRICPHCKRPIPKL